MISTVIFDLDGTLINSEKAVLGAFKHVLELHGQPYNEITVRSHVGRRLEDTYTLLVPSHDPKALAIMHRDWQIEHKQLLKAYEGLDNFLAELKELGLRLAAYTSASRMRTEVMLQVTGIAPYFEVILCGDEVSRPKPDGEGVKVIMKQLSVQPHQTIMVGDAIHDIEAGQDAGVATIAITHGFGTKAALQKAGADYLVGNLKELQIKLVELMLDI